MELKDPTLTEIGAVAANLSEIRAGGVGAQQFALHVLLNALDHAVLVQEVHLVFGRVDVHVDVLWGDFQAAGVRKHHINSQHPPFNIKKNLE